MKTKYKIGTVFETQDGTLCKIDSITINSDDVVYRTRTEDGEKGFFEKEIQCIYKPLKMPKRRKSKRGRPKGKKTVTMPKKLKKAKQLKKPTKTNPNRADRHEINEDF